MSKTTNKFSPEVRERAVRLVLDNDVLPFYRNLDLPVNAVLTDVSTQRNLHRLSR